MSLMAMLDIPQKGTKNWWPAVEMLKLGNIVAKFCCPATKIVLSAFSLKFVKSQYLSGALEGG